MRPEPGTLPLDSGANDMRLEDMEPSVTLPTFADFCAAISEGPSMR